MVVFTDGDAQFKVETIEEAKNLQREKNVHLIVMQIGTTLDVKVLNGQYLFFISK